MANLTLTKNKALLGPGSARGVVAEAAKGSALALALAENKAFPAGTTKLGKVSLSAKEGKDVVFGKGQGKVAFKGHGGAFGGLGVFPSGADVLAALALDADLGKVALADVADSHFVMLRWGYDVGAAAKGSVALGAGLAPTFEADASSEGQFAVIRQLPKKLGARTSIQRVVNSWALPKQVRSIDQMDPGSWLVAEVDGSIGLELGARYGYDFNWVREAKLGGLSGDIGLRLQLGVSVALGFSASGKYAVVLSRDSLGAADKKIRLRLFKLDKKGWSFALNAGATVQGDTGKFLPGQFDQFIAAVLGLDPAQLLDDLRSLEKWTDPSKSIPDLLAGAGVDAAKELLEDITGFDVATEFEKARKQVLGLLGKWDKLDHVVATRLWSMVGNQQELARVRALAQQVAQASPESVRALITKRLSEVDFLTRTPEGQWLAAGLGDRLLKVLTTKTDLNRLRSLAKRTLAVLDGGPVQETLGKLHARISRRLGIDKIRKAATETSFAKLDAWQKAKLSRFLGSKIDFSKLQEIRKTIDLLLQKRQQFYDRAVAALNKSYQFSFAAAYQKNTASTALLDVEFDFGVADVSAKLRGAVDGKFDDLLVDPVPGVTLNVATLSHEVSRQGSVSVDLPFFDKDVTRLNKALAKVSAVEDDGRVLLYDLDASDTVTESVNAKTRRNSRMAIGGVVARKLAASDGPAQIRQHSGDGLTYDYTFHQATRNLQRRGLEFRLEPYADRYFPDHFAAEGSFSSWLTNLDRTIDGIENNGADVFGNTLISLRVSLPPAVTDAWLEAPKDPKAPQYGEMSRRIQRALRQTLYFYYFQNPKRFTKPLTSARALLAYAALPVSTSIKVKAGKLELDTGKDVIWDQTDPKQREAMVRNSRTALKLGAFLNDISRRLAAEPGFSKTERSHYNPSQTNRNSIEEAALEGVGATFFNSLLRVETQVVRAAVEAGVAMAAFQSQMTEKPSAAVKSLARFGSRITSAFNNKLRGQFDGGALRPLGSQLYVAAAMAFDEKLAKGKGAAMAELVVLEGDVDFPPAGFPNHAPTPAGDVLVAQRLVNDRLKLDVDD